jgi:hypothetical protein
VQRHHYVDNATNFELPKLSKSMMKEQYHQQQILDSIGINIISLSFKDFNSIMEIYWNG